MTKITFPEGRKRANDPDPVDVHVGSRLRLRRKLLGLSQEQLGKSSGLTFQQIQKYERGANRMGASRLFQLAQLLTVPVSYFFEEMAGLGLAASLGVGFNDASQEPLDRSGHIGEELLHRRETLELVRAYYGITDPKQRRKIYELVRTMTEPKAEVNS